MAQYTEDTLNYARFRDLPGAVYTRSGVAYQQDASGVWVPFDEDVPPISDGVGLGVWEAATNSLLWSEEIASAAYAKTRLTVGSNAIAAPNGTLTGDSLTRTSTTQGCFVSQTLSATVGQPVIFFRVLKAKSVGGRYGLRIQGAYPDRGDAVFDLVAGTVVGTYFFGAITAVTAGISPISDGWFLCWVSVPAAPATTTLAIEGPTDSSQTIGSWEGPTATLNDAYVWGGQVVLNSNRLVPYIPTTSAPATRGAPSAYLNAPGVLVPPFTVQVWAQLPALDGVLRRFVTLSADTDENNQIVIERTAGNQLAMQAITGGAAQSRACLLGGYTGARLVKCALRVRAGAYTAAVGGVVQPEIAASMPSMSRITPGARPNFANQFNGDLTRLQVINRDLTDAELVALTA